MRELLIMLGAIVGHYAELDPGGHHIRYTVGAPFSTDTQFVILEENDRWVGVIEIKARNPHAPIWGSRNNGAYRYSGQVGQAALVRWNMDTKEFVLTGVRDKAPRKAKEI